MSNAKFARRLLAQITHLHQRANALVDCLTEAQNNVVRAEWDFAAANLRKLFRNAAAITRQRDAAMRELRKFKET